MEYVRGERCGGDEEKKKKIRDETRGGGAREVSVIDAGQSKLFPAAASRPSRFLIRSQNTERKRIALEKKNNTIEKSNT